MLITPLPRGFGAEIGDFDLRHGRAPDDIARLQQAYENLHLLVFRGDAEIPAERQVEIASWFGPVGCEAPPFTVLDNDEPTGRAELPFHCDITFVEFPLKGISLHPLALPATATSTTYVSNALAWEALPEALKRQLEDRRARHFYDSSHDMGFDWPVFEHWHPVRLQHPGTGRALLFVTEHHVSLIEGMDEARSAAVLSELFAALYAPERRYEHVWRAGDLVIWDNLAIQHARTRAAEPSEGRRVLRRVQLAEVGFLEQAERVRRQQAQAAG